MSAFPSCRRVALALGAAASAAALVGAAPFESLAVTLFPAVLIVTSLHAVMIGAPAYFSLRASRNLTYEISAMAGAIIGAVPIGLIVFLPAGHVEADPIFLVFAGAGAFGGLVFRAVLGSAGAKPARRSR